MHKQTVLSILTSNVTDDRLHMQAVFIIIRQLI